uniref:RING finger protein 37 isoform X2 n=1 Tax=Myxine glutinosa TaxID=7769 RepID=UPI00358ECBA0
MALNVCVAKLGSRIHCDKISADGYEADNLISTDVTARSRGFRPEYFIKPPLELTLSLAFPVELTRVDVRVVLGQRGSSGIQVLTSSGQGKEDANLDVFIQVGRATLSASESVSFCRHVCHSSFPVAGRPDPVNVPGKGRTLELCSKGAALLAVRFVRVRMQYASGGGVPCIKDMAVWGQPSKICSRDLLKQVYEKADDDSLNKAQLHCTPVPVIAAESNACVAKERTPLQNVASEDLPEEFKDTITRELMMMPMLLPSGQTVDQTTLDRFFKSEEQWGRKPSDPFTGRHFVDGHRPLPNVLLKSRIDHFLLQSGASQFNVLGRQTQSETSMQLDIQTHRQKRKRDAEERANQHSNPPSSCGDALERKPLEACLDRRKGDGTNINGPHGDLSDALDAALRSLPKFTCLSSRHSAHLSRAVPKASTLLSEGSVRLREVPQQCVCSSCRKTLTRWGCSDPVFRLSCDHLLCRPCVVQAQRGSGICPLCLTAFKSQDLIRVHLE